MFYPIDRAAAQTSRWLKELLGVEFGYELISCQASSGGQTGEQTRGDRGEEVAHWRLILLVVSFLFREMDFEISLTTTERARGLC